MGEEDRWGGEFRRALRSSPSSGVTTPGSQRTVLEGLEVRVTASVIELKLFEGKDWSERPSRRGWGLVGGVS